MNSFKTEANTKCFLTGSEDKLVRKWSLNEYDKIEAEKLIIGKDFFLKIYHRTFKWSQIRDHKPNRSLYLIML